MNKYAENLQSIETRIENACDAFLLPKTAVLPHIVAVSKYHTIERITPLLIAKHRIFGENRVQEAEEKWPQLKNTYNDIELHLIGPLQTNKVKDAVRLFNVIETIDRPKLAKAIAKELENTDKKIECYIQINTGEEEQKAGILPKDADCFIKDCVEELKLPIVGLMCIPPVDEDPAQHFALLKKIAKRHDLPKLSMGMSGDFELATALGATHVRVGTAIFGERD
jgi:pyridoxal phosphate enzyme (YggS family)